MSTLQYGLQLILAVVFTAPCFDRGFQPFLRGLFIIVKDFDELKIIPPSPLFCQFMMLSVTNIA